jgi:predicted nucleic acid-binding protein
MTIDRETRVFFDTSCLIAAAGSPSGGSGFLVSLCQRGLLRGAVSQPVLLEAERNIRKKRGPAELETYHRLIALTPLLLVPLPPPAQRPRYAALVGDKDEHVLAAAIEGRAPFLITLDGKLAERVNQATLPTRALSPGDFITTRLPEHVDYPRLR